MDAADKVFFVDGPSPYVAHLEFQAGPDAEFDLRMMWYNVLLRRQHKLLVRSVAFLLSPKAAGRGVTGRFAEVLEPPHCIEFHYSAVRAWELPVEPLVNGPLGTAPLATVAARADDVLRVFERLADRATAAEDRAVGDRLLTTAFVLAGLRHDRDVLDDLYRKARGMPESISYQMIIEEGEARGQARGAVLEARSLLLRLGGRKFGPPGEAVRASIEKIDDTRQLETLADGLFDAATWDALLAGPPRA